MLSEFFSSCLTCGLKSECSARVYWELYHNYSIKVKLSGRHVDTFYPSIDHVPINSSVKSIFINDLVNDTPPVSIIESIINNKNINNFFKIYVLKNLSTQSISSLRYKMKMKGLMKNQLKSSQII